MGGFANSELYVYALSLRGCLAYVGFDQVDFGLDRCSSLQLRASRRGLLRCLLGC